eukprot:486043_1
MAAVEGKWFIGDEVILVNDNHGTIRYIGRIRKSGRNSKAIWYGIELKNRKGNTDGSIGTRQYFACDLNYGVFVKQSQIKHRVQKIIQMDYKSFDLHNYDTLDLRIFYILSNWLKLNKNKNDDIVSNSKYNKYNFLFNIDCIKLIKQF